MFDNFTKINQKIITFLVIFQISAGFTFAQIPVYYQNVNFQLSGQSLQNQLSQLVIQTHTTFIPYTSSFETDVWDALRICDLNENDQNNVLLIYGWNNTDGLFSTDRTRPKTATCHTSACTGLWEREHVYPRSLGTPNLSLTEADSDIHNLRPIDSNRNNTRSNNKFTQGSGEASSIPFSGAWYPGDEWKGDVARMMMYMYLRYPTQCLPNNVAIGTSNFSTLGDMPDIFLIWNAQDPVAYHEIARNNLSQNLQGNRNPFIDNPYLATLIWSGPLATDHWDLANLSQEVYAWQPDVQVLPNITTNYVYVQSNNEPQKYHYYVVNQLGQKVASGDTSHQIDLSEFANGLYYIVLSNTTHQYNFKVIKH